MEKKRKADPKSGEKPKGKESKLTRRTMVKSLAVGTLALSVPGVSHASLLEQGLKVCGSPENARRFLEGMLDPKIRDQMERNPASVIARYGIQVPKEMLPKTVKLPPAEEIRNLIRAIDTGQGTIQVQALVVVVFLAFFAFFAFFRK
jgi:hypothetical protein